jgi:hypothetical protein
MNDDRISHVPVEGNGSRRTANDSVFPWIARQEAGGSTLGTRYDLGKFVPTQQITCHYGETLQDKERIFFEEGNGNLAIQATSHHDEVDLGVDAQHSNLSGVITFPS